MGLKRVDILQPLYERLKTATASDTARGLVYGLCAGYGGISHPVAVALINYIDDASLELATRTLPFGFTIFGLVEFEEDECQDVYTALDNVEHPILFKIISGKVSASTGLDYLQPLHMNVVPPEVFWQKTVTTYRVRGKFLLGCLLETPNVKDCFTSAKSRVLNQAAYAMGKNGVVTILPRSGHLSTEITNLKQRRGLKVSDLVQYTQSKEDERGTYFQPGMTLIDVEILHDKTKANSWKKATILVEDKSARCKLFEHYVDIDVLLIIPSVMSAQHLYRKFNAAVCRQLDCGFHVNIIQQLGNSITAERPEVFHFWPAFAQHFVTVLYPQNTSEEKLKERRYELHTLFFARETRPFFRRPASLFQPSVLGLLSPHLGLSPKFAETQLIRGHYEYRHYMQDDFNDNGWGCAYRSLQTIVSWFRLQGFTSRPIPTHLDIQECLVSLGDKPVSFVNSKQWIGSTEVGFVLEALLGVSCRIMALSNGAEMASRSSELLSHFKAHGTPVMIGGGVLAHTIIGVSRNPSNENEVQYLVLDPHYTGRDDLKTITTSGWVGWKDNSFWSKTDFYNICMPLLPSSI